MRMIHTMGMASRDGVDHEPSGGTGSAQGGRFDDRVVVVTGAASGIGRAVAALVAARGANTVLVDLRPPEIDAAFKLDKTMSLAADQRETADVQAAVEAVDARFGRIDVLLNVAGIDGYAAVAETSDDLWERILSTNLTGVFRWCRAVLPGMLERQRGAIVNVGSAAAFGAYPGIAAYAASKAGLLGFNRVLAAEAAPHVRVNVVAPGPVATPLTDKLRTGASSGPDAAIADRLVTRDTPLARWGRPEEIAEAIAFAASDAASFMTGQVVHVNGGRVMP